jgi:hypothetical protein
MYRNQPCAPIVARRFDTWSGLSETGLCTSPPLLVLCVLESRDHVRVPNTASPAVKP